MTAEQIERVVDGFDRLKKKEQKVLALHYRMGFKLKDIGEVLELSVGRVSQLHVSAMRKLKACVL